MINRIKIAYIFLLIFIVGVFLIFFIVKNNKSRKISHSNLVAIMLETEPGIYTKSQSNNWPSNNEYVFNSEKSYCLHGGTIIWNGNNISFNTNGADKCFAYFKKIENVSEDLKNKILDLNGGVESIKAKGIPNFNSPATTNEGMFATQDDHGTSYYFRGAIDNNWVYFAGFYWRIVRINGDGSVKMIYTGAEAPTSAESVIMTGTKTHIGTEHFSPNNENAEALGYMYAMEEQRGSSSSSEVKSYIDTWYRNNIIFFDDYLSDFIVCNDRGFTKDNWVPIGLPDDIKFSDAYIRLNTYNSPQLTCPNEGDAFTVSTETKGNGKLTYPVGLLTADEAWMAGTNNLHENKLDYLYSNNIYWLNTPYSANDLTTTMFIRDSSGEIYQMSPSYKDASVRPVISLKGDTLVLGTGKYNDPFKLPPPDPVLETILLNNGGTSHIESKGTPDFTVHSTTNEGMFSAPDDYGTSYYFRGAIDNNWVKFGKEDGNDIWWRIVRINGDDSVKLIYTGTTAPTEEEKVVMTGSGTQTETSAFNTLSNRAEYIGYMYTLNEHRGHSTNSTTKTTLDTWYTNNLSDYEKYLSDFVVCNDRGFENNWVPLELPTSGSHNSNAHSRNYPSSGTSTPSLICPNQDDAYTKNDNIKGNAKLTNQIGLLTADEVTLTGAYKATSNNAYYLYTRQNYWLVSPDYVNLYYATEFCVGSHGGLGDYSVTNTFGVRPVISLSSDLSVSGSGQWNDPYIPILD